MSNGLLSNNRSLYQNYVPEGDLRDKLDRLTQSTPTELVSLFDEIAVMRAFAEDGIQMYAAAEKIDDPMQRLKLRQSSVAMVTQCLSKIESLSLTAAKIDQYNKTSNAIQIAKIIVDEAVTTADRHFKHLVPGGLIAQFAKELRNSFEITEGMGEVGMRRNTEAIAMQYAMDAVTQATAIPEPDVRPVVIDHKPNGHAPNGPTPEVVQ